jgi:MOSC domain-containing protein YiiM
MQGNLTQLNVSGGGVPKQPILRGEVTPLGLIGDTQRDKKHHGGPDRALCLYSLELIEALRREGHPIAPGTTGENLTLSGLDWAELGPGSRLQLGSQVQLEITGYATPCRTIQASFADRRFGRISQKTHPGWSRLYARVLRTGVVNQGDIVRVMPATPNASTESAT